MLGIFTIPTDIFPNVTSSGVGKGGSDIFELGDRVQGSQETWNVKKVIFIEETWIWGLKISEERGTLKNGAR